MNHLLYKTRSICYDSIILYVLLPTICAHCLANVVPSKRSESLIHCLLVTVYVWYFIQRQCKWLLLSVNLEKACVTVFKTWTMLPKIQVWMKLKENILYHMHHVKPILLVWLLALCRVRTLFCEQNSRLFPDFFQTIFFIFQTQDNSEILHGPRRNNCLNYENNE